MEPKKCRSTSFAGVSSAAPSTSSVADPDGRDDQEYDMMDASSRNDCMRAGSALQCGNSVNALKISKEILLRHPKNAAVHILRSKIYMKLCCDVRDPTLRQMYLKNALDASRRAVSLAPSSLLCAVYHAKLFFKIAKDDEGLAEAVRECRRGLNIEFPEGRGNDQIYRASDNSRRHLRQLLENIQELRSNPGKTFGDEFWNDSDLNLEEYFRETEEDKTGDFKKVVHQLTGTNLLHQHLSPSTNMEQMDFHPSSRLRKMEDKRKYTRLKKGLLPVTDMAKTRSYWNTISVDEKQDFLKIRIEDIQTHLSSLKDKLPLKIFSEAVQYAMDNKSWKYWECCDCCERFEDWDLIKQHFREKHLDEISPRIKAMPEAVDRVWIEKLIHCPWKPIDTQKALKMMELESKDSSVDHTDAGIDERENFVSPAIDSEYETFCQQAETPVIGEGESSVISADDREWPFSDDADRSQILDRAKTLFLTLLTKNCLSFWHFNWIIRLAITHLQSVIPMALISKFSLDKTPLSICFLETSMLRPVHDTLSLLTDSLDLSLFHEENYSTDDPKLPARMRVVFSRDFSSLVLDKRLMSMDLNDTSDDESVEDDGCAVASDSDDHEHEAASESVDFLTCLFSGSPIEDHILFWTRALEAQKRQGLARFRNYKMEIGKLRDLWSNAHQQKTPYEVMRKIGTSIMESVLQDYESILLKRQQELDKEEPNVMTMCSDEIESSFIREILEGARALYVCESECRESEEMDEPTTQRRNSSIKETIQLLDFELSLALGITEAKIRRISFEVHKLELKLKSVTGYDYREFIYPLLKCFSRMRLEDLVSKNAAEKSEAAREALLAELELDAKRNVQKREENRGKKPKKWKKKTRKKNISGAKASEELHEVEEHQNSVAPNDHSAMDIQGPPGFDFNAMDVSEEAVLGSTIDECQDDAAQLDIHFEQIHVSDSNEEADNLAASIAQSGLEISRISPGGTAMDFDGNMISSSKLGMPVINAQRSLPKREESRGKRPKRSKNKKGKKNSGGAKASKEPPEMEEHQNPRKQNVHSASQLRGPPLFDSSAMDTGEIGKCEEAGMGTDIDEWQEHVSHLDNQFKQLEISDSDEEADRGIAENIAAGVAQSGLEMSGDSPEVTRTSFDTAKISLPKREENEGKKPKKWIWKKTDLAKRNFDGNIIKSSELGMPIDDLRDSKFKQTQVSEFNDTAENLAAGMRLNDYEMSADKMNIERKMIGSSDSGEQINDQNDAQMLAKKDADPESNKQHKPYDFTFGSFTCEVDFDMNRSSNQVELRNDAPEYNCFLNAIIQSLRHLRSFQDEFVEMLPFHGHTGDPCVVCCLFHILTDVKEAAKKKSYKVVDAGPLRYALSYFFPGRTFFQKGEMNDASEVLGSIFRCLHLSVTTALDGIVLREDREQSGSGDYKSCDCLAHTLFVTNITVSMRCRECDLLSRFAHYSSFFHHLNAKELRDMKISHRCSTFSELLKLVYMDGPEVQCEPASQGCGASKNNHPSRSIKNLPRYFILVLGWESIEESPETISATLASLAADMDMSLVYEGLEKETKYCLVSLVCCFGWHYVCFGYNKAIKRWFLFDDTAVKLIGKWDEVLILCKNRHFQPQILFFESVL